MSLTLFTPFDPWKSSLCTCPSKYSLSCYVGCGHNCLYCYASSYIPNFYYPRSKKNFLLRLEREIKKVPANSLITISNSTDPYQPLEKQKKIIQNTLNILKEYRLKILIVTKSSLILRDKELLKNMKNISVCFSITSLQEKLANKLEPKATPVKERLKAVKILSGFLPVSLRVDPIIYPLTIKEIPSLISAAKENGAKQIICSTYKAKPDNFKRMINAFPEYKSIFEKLYKQRGEKKGNYIYLPYILRRKIIEYVRRITLEHNLYFSCCREGFADLNTLTCDGSSLISKIT